MLEPRRIESNVTPKVFEDLGNGNWYYNYGIESKQVTIAPMGEDDTERTETRYSYIQIKMTGKPTYKRCVELVIREYLTQSQEFDLINSYNRVALSLLSDTEAEKAADDYLNYLHIVSVIKDNIKKDFE